MNVFSAIVAVIAILAVVKITQHWLAARADTRASAESAKYRQELEQLESRVRTLERIVTDDRESLSRRIDDLK